MRGKLLVVSDWLINGSLKFYSRIAPPPPFAKGGGGQLLKRSGSSAEGWGRGELGVELLCF